MKKVTCAGILVADLIAADLPRVSPPGGITFAPYGIGLHIGGHAANVSIDLVGLGLKASEVGCVGAVGKDIFGSFLERALKQHRISVRLQRTGEGATSVDLILVVQGEDRRFHCHVGANALLEPDFVMRFVYRDRPKVFYVGGVGLMDRFDRELKAVLKEVKELGSLTFVDPVMPQNKSWSHLRQALPAIDILHCNEEEAQSLTGRVSLERAMRELLSSGVSLVLVTKGRKGVAAGRRGQLLTLDGFAVDPVDPTGAGDAFCAALIRKVVQEVQRRGQPTLDWTDQRLVPILVEAQAAGAACVTGIGTTSAVKRRNVASLLSAQASRVRESLSIRPL